MMPSNLMFYWLIILAFSATMLAEAVLYWIVLKLHWTDSLFISLVANTCLYSKKYYQINF